MLHYNKKLYSAIYEEIQEIEEAISFYKEMILQTKRDLVQIDFRILQTQNIRKDLLIRERALLIREKAYQKYLDRASNIVSELRKNILTC